MKTSNPSSFLAAYALGVLLVAQTCLAQSIALAYCSSLNTASMSANSSIYQSEGLCHDFCVENYAFAILQYQDCWCSNYAPGTTTDTSDCDTSCPGYTSDICGGDDLYGYLALSVSPSGTEGASSSKATSTSTSTKSSSTTTADDATTTGTSQSSSATSTWTPTPVTSVETITGQVRTVTYTPTAPPASVSESSGSSGGHSGLNTGQAVGLAVGLIALVAIIAGAIFFWLRRRRQQEQEKDFGSPGRRESFATALPSQSMSDNSRYMLGTDGRQVVEGWDTDNQAGSRRSRLMPVDPRLDPFAPLYQRVEHAKSRDSINTLRDDQDYSRKVSNAPVLRATNPDS